MMCSPRLVFTATGLAAAVTFQIVNNYFGRCVKQWQVRTLKDVAHEVIHPIYTK